MQKEQQLKTQLAEYLRENHRGMKNAVKLKHIPYGQRSKRDVRRAIHWLRTEGVPICSYSNGYFYAETKHEIDICIMYIESMQIRIKDVLQGLEESKERLGD